MKKITHYFKKNLGICITAMVMVFLVPIALHAAGTVVNTTIKFTPVTVSKTAAGTASATTTITYVNSSKTNTTTVSGTSIDAVLYKKNMFGFTTELVRTNITTVAAKYNVAAPVAAKFINLDETQEYWISFNETDFPSTIVKSANFTLAAKTLKFGGGKFGGAGALGSWTEGVTAPPKDPTTPVIPPVTPKDPTTPKPSNVTPDAEPVAPTTYELEFRFLPDAWLQTLKAKGSVKYTSSNGSKGVLAGTITLTPIAYNGDRLTTETFTLPNINVESGNTYPLEFSFTQTIPLGVSISKVELGSLDDTSIYPVSGTLTGPATNVITGADGKSTTFSISKAVYDAAKKTINIVGSITYTDGFVATDKYNKILVDIYSDGTKVSTKNIVFTKSATGNTIDFNSIITDVDTTKTPTTFKIRDNSIEVISNLFPITAGVTQAAQGGIQAKDTVTVTGGVAAGTKVNFKLTPFYKESTSQIWADASVTYDFPDEKDYSGGTTVFSLYNKDGLVESKTFGSLQVLVDNYEYKFNASTLIFNNIDKTKAPFTIKILEKDLNVSSEAFNVNTAINSSNNPGSPTAPPQTSSLTVPSGEFKGKKVDISVTSSTLVANANVNTKIAKTLPALFATYAEAQGTTQPHIDVTGSIKYNDFNSPDINKIGGIKFVLKGKSGVIATQDSLDVVNQSGANLSVPIPFATQFNNVDKTQSPFTVEITEKDLGVTSAGFRVAEASNSPAGGDVNGDGIVDGNDTPAPADAGVSQNRISLGNPLKDGLDSIPAIVSVLVKDIVIPIAVPFLALSIIYTGFLFVQARGNAEKLKEAKAALKWTLIGGAVILGAYVIATALQATIADIVK